MEPSFPQFTSQSLDLPSQGSSSHIFSCKWAWCRNTFSDNAALVHHVIHDHARRSIPVRRRDVAMIRRVEEGSGDSLHVSSLVKGMYASSSQKSIQNSKVQDSSSERPNPSSSSLPSPPNSSPSIDTFHLRDEQFLDHENPTTKPSTSKFQAEAEGRNADENGPSMQPFYEDAMRHFQLPSAPELGGFQAQPELSSPPTFASFNSPAATPPPVSIPASPSFSSLVSKKRRLNFDLPEHEPTSRTSLRSRSHPLSQSTSTESTSASQASVAMQLTQSLSDDDSDNDEDAQGEVDDMELEVPEQSSKHLAAELNTDNPKDEELYEEELSWGSENPSESEETAHTFADFGSLSQPPSQFQFDSFPIHHHGPKASHPPPIDTVPSSSALPPLSTPAPLSSPTFAISTPVRQNWYQPVVRRKSSSKQSVHEAELDREGIQMSQENSHLQSTNGASPASKSKLASKKKSVFRSGTLQITPISLMPESPPPKQDEKVLQLEQVDSIPHEIQDFSGVLDTSQDYMDLDNSDSFDEFSYPPLQTQAPYESQTTSQL